MARKFSDEQLLIACVTHRNYIEGNISKDGALEILSKHFNPENDAVYYNFDLIIEDIKRRLNGGLSRHLALPYNWAQAMLIVWPHKRKEIINAYNLEYMRRTGKHPERQF